MNSTKKTTTLQKKQTSKGKVSKIPLKKPMSNKNILGIIIVGICLVGIVIGFLVSQSNDFTYENLIVDIIPDPSDPDESNSTETPSDLFDSTLLLEYHDNNTQTWGVYNGYLRMEATAPLWYGVTSHIQLLNNQNFTEYNWTCNNYPLTESGSVIIHHNPLLIPNSGYYFNFTCAESAPMTEFVFLYSIFQRNVSMECYELDGIYQLKANITGFLTGSANQSVSFPIPSGFLLQNITIEGKGINETEWQYVIENGVVKIFGGSFTNTVHPIIFFGIPIAATSMRKY